VCYKISGANGLDVKARAFGCQSAKTSDIVLSAGGHDLWLM